MMLKLVKILATIYQDASQGVLATILTSPEISVRREKALIHSG